MLYDVADRSSIILSFYQSFYQLSTHQSTPSPIYPFTKESANLARSLIESHFKFQLRSVRTVADDDGDTDDDDMMMMI